MSSFTSGSKDDTSSLPQLQVLSLYQEEAEEFLIPFLLDNTELTKLEVLDQISYDYSLNKKYYTLETDEEEILGTCSVEVRDINKEDDQVEEIKPQEDVQEDIEFLSKKTQLKAIIKSIVMISKSKDIEINTNLSKYLNVNFFNKLTQQLKLNYNLAAIEIHIGINQESLMELMDYLEFIEYGGYINEETGIMTLKFIKNYSNNIQANTFVLPEPTEEVKVNFTNKDTNNIVDEIDGLDSILSSALNNLNVSNSNDFIINVDNIEDINSIDLISQAKSNPNGFITTDNSNQNTTSSSLEDAIADLFKALNNASPEELLPQE